MRTAIALTLLSLAMSAGAAEPSPIKMEQAQNMPPASLNGGLQTADGEKQAAGEEQAVDAVPAVRFQAPATSRQSATAGRPAIDHLALDTTVVTGNRELPKVLYIVPWKKAELGDLPAQPFNTLLDEALTPLDRDVFRREVTYYDAVSAGVNAPAAAAAAPAVGPEK